MSEIIQQIIDAPWLHDEAVQKIFALLDGKLYRTKAVGGIVRDSIMGRLGNKNDVDFATELEPDEVIELAQKAGIKYYPTGIDHGTVTLAVNDNMFEITSLRQDIDTDGRHAKVRFGEDWLADAKRRDFTINALYVGYDGSLFDPLGEGLDDCKNSIVRFIGDADERIKEDKLRIYRFFRFSASHGNNKLDKHGLMACKKFAPDLNQVSHERIGAEMMKILALKSIIASFSAMMRVSIFPKSENVIANFEYYEAIVANLNMNPNASERLAIIFAHMQAIQLQKDWRLSNAQIRKSKTILKLASLVNENKIYEAAYTLSKEKQNFAQSITFASILNVAGAVFNWKYEKCKKMLKNLQAINTPPFPISGNDLLALGFTSGFALGENLAKLEQQWIKSQFKLTKAQLLAKAKPQLKSSNSPS